MDDQERGALYGRDKDRSRGRGGRRRERGFRDRSSRGKGDFHGSQQQITQMKTPILLTKASPGEWGQDAPVMQILTKPRERSQEAAITASPVLPATKILSKSSQGDEHAISSIASPSHHSVKRNTTPSLAVSSAATRPTGGMDSSTVKATSSKPSPTEAEMPAMMKLVDENMHWNDSALEMLLDQTDFLVVGALGPQGAGKSTIMSALAGVKSLSESRSFLFQPQSRQAQENGCNQTSGVDLAVTAERIILLDTQPLLSPAVLDHLIHHDRNIPSDYSSPESYNEMQSLQIATFLLTVCHVILLVQDWFTDVNIIRFLKTAEMLKPSTVSHPMHETTSLNGPEEADEHFPNLVFVYNKSSREDFHPENLSSMLFGTSALLQHSRMKIHSGISLCSTRLVSPPPCDDLNFYLLPFCETQENGFHGGNGNSSGIPSYKGHPSFQLILEALRNQIFSVHRHPLTHHSLTEKNWFHYAARSWETVRKSTLLSEYNRLLSG